MAIPTIGGRYSVLSAFGLVPAAAVGIDVRDFSHAPPSGPLLAAPSVPPHEQNPGVRLGAILGVARNQGRDKVTITSSEKVADFGAWAEQLIAESTERKARA